MSSLMMKLWQFHSSKSPLLGWRVHIGVCCSWGGASSVASHDLPRAFVRLAESNVHNETCDWGALLFFSL